ncbi:hypothetical protein JCM4814A_02730 [Streptomyces phaeofaciens JCM 4814]|uniref:Uncharacterized protein n=1 Tax=Streptomyces phaeofaciens TaxID=68254 RepID=A0A918HQF7_9ACTN|nr:hypothetical protein GCM10010226_83510 [Streptomyces phaeofaciens]
MPEGVRRRLAFRSSLRPPLTGPPVSAAPPNRVGDRSEMRVPRRVGPWFVAHGRTQRLLPAPATSANGASV